MALNQARKGCKGILAVIENPFLLCLLLIGSSYSLVWNIQINTMFQCVLPLLPFPVTIYNPYFYIRAEHSFIILPSTHLMYFDGEHTFIITKIRWTQPIRVKYTILTLIDANVLVCIVLPVQLLSPGRCGCVWGDRYCLVLNDLWILLLYKHYSLFVLFSSLKAFNPFIDSTMDF